MRHEINKTLTKTYQTFSDFVELSTKLSSSQFNKGWDEADNKGSASFFGDTNSFDEMVKRCYDGYNAKGISTSRTEIGNLIMTEVPTDALKHSGEALDIPTYLSGDMKCFWAEDSHQSSPKRIHITFGANCIASVDSTQFYNHGGAVAVICDALDNIGAQTKITCTFTNTSVLGGEALQVIEVKDYNESIDVARIGVTTHPSFFRRIGFRYFERLGNYLGKGKEWLDSSTSYGASQTGKNRNKVVSDNEFSDWLRIDEDEIVVDLPAADNSVFEDTDSTAKWVTEAIEKINNNTSLKHIKIYE
jgi:hypothetical protein